MAEAAEAQVEQTPAPVTETSTPAPTEQSPASTEATDGAEQAATILAAVEANPALAEDPEVAALLKLANPETGKSEKGTEEKPEEGTEKKPEKKPKGKTDDKPEDKPKGEKTDDKSKEKSDSVFFKSENKEVEKVGLKDLDAFNAHIEEKYSIKDADKFFNSVDGWRTQAQNAEKVQGELDNITDSFSKMPEALFNAYTLWAKGDPWEKAVQGVGTLDFNLGFGEYDTQTIVNHYFPGDFNKDDFTGENKDSVTTKRAINLAKSQYESDRQSVKDQRASHIEDAETSKELIKTSSISSVENLKQAFPDMGKTELKKVQSIMSSGDLTALFFTKEGGYVDDAAEKIAMMLYAKKDIASANKRTKSSQEALIEKVDAGNEKPSTTTSTQGKKAVVPEEVSNLHKDLQETMIY